jgi:hypothetical protein
MAAALREVFDVPVRWLEGESRNTAENARFSADMLGAAASARGAGLPGLAPAPGRRPSSSGPG